MIKSQYMKVGLFSFIQFVQILKESSSLGPSLRRNASRRSLCRVRSVTWWACLVRARCATFKNELAVPEDAISASVRADVHPEPSKTSPRVFQRTISVCRPPSITTCTLSPCVSGHFHCTHLARANRGWSKVVTGTCPGFRYSTACLTTSMPCFIIAGVADFSWNKGRRAQCAGRSSSGGCIEEW